MMGQDCEGSPLRYQPTDWHLHSPLSPGPQATSLETLHLVFRQQLLSYAKEDSRIAYLIGLLHGNTLSWATAVWEQQSLIANSNAAFTTEMKRAFDHPLRGKDASKRLLSLHQGMRSVAEYSVEFRTLATEHGWNSEDLQAAFCNGLNETLKDELVS